MKWNPELTKMIRSANWYRSVYWKSCLMLQCPREFLADIFFALNQNIKEEMKSDPEITRTGWNFPRYFLPPSCNVPREFCMPDQNFCSPLCLLKTSIPAKQLEQQGWAAVFWTTAVSLSGITLLSGHEECVLPLECFPCGHTVSGRGILSSAEKACTVRALMRNNSFRKCIMQDCKLWIFIQSEWGWVAASLALSC